MLGSVVEQRKFWEHAQSCLKAAKKANSVLAFIGRGSEYKSWKVVAVIQNIHQATPSELCAVLIATLQERFDSAREGAEKKMHEDDAWTGGLEL